VDPAFLRDVGIAHGFALVPRHYPCAAKGKETLKDIKRAELDKTITT
jgi:hypothetical protein